MLYKTIGMILAYAECISKIPVTGRLRLSLDFMQNISQLVFQQKHAQSKPLLPRKMFHFCSFFSLSVFSLECRRFYGEYFGFKIIEKKLIPSQTCSMFFSPQINCSHFFFLKEKAHWVWKVKGHWKVQLLLLMVKLSEYQHKLDLEISSLPFSCSILPPIYSHDHLYSKSIIVLSLFPYIPFTYQKERRFILWIFSKLKLVDGTWKRTEKICTVTLQSGGWGVFEKASTQMNL